MIQLRRQVLLFAFRFFDLLVMLLSFFAALWASTFAEQGPPGSLGATTNILFETYNPLTLVGFGAAWHIIFSLSGLYRSRRLSNRQTEFLDVLKAATLGTSGVLILASFFRIHIFTPIFISVFWAMSSALSLFGRVLMRFALSYVRARGRNLRFMLIIGTNRRAIEFARRIESKKDLGYRIIGFMDTDWSGLVDLRRSGYRLLGDILLFPGFIKDNVVDEVVLGLPIKSFYDQSLQIIRLCEEQGILVRLLPDMFNLTMARTNVDQFEDYPMLTLVTGRMGDWLTAVKRGMDICVSLVLLILLSPLFFLIAAGIKATSAGPVFFAQERIGLNKRRFKIFKFRTMVQDAEQKIRELETRNEVSGPVFKMNDDPRVTSLGKLLRKTSLDELPQLFNVVKGDMSLVGPRPLPVRDYEGFTQDWHRRRFSVRPGITCLWQVNGRHTIPFEHWMELDMKYIDEWSLMLDFKILAKTIPAVLEGTEGLKVSREVRRNLKRP
jgi:exopolysaccharide biosynthesis polyprenyl glycosylphosphotransferase